MARKPPAGAPPGSPPQRPTALQRAKELVARRKEVRLWLQSRHLPQPAGVVGLALSGGGIRSATFSLGLLQALAKSKRDALSRIDILSTVSGGGYIGCFLRSLFLPNAARGIEPELGKGRGKPNLSSIANQYKFARKVLTSGTHDKNVKWKTPGGRPVVRRSPLWWLREHSRFLAPNGPTDYGYALAYIARNWLAMLYIFVVASLAIFSALVLAEAGSYELCASPQSIPIVREWISAAACAFIGTARTGRILISPVILFAIIPISISIAVSVSYWMTQAMSPNEPRVRTQWKNLALATGGTLFVGGFIIAAAAWIGSRAHLEGGTAELREVSYWVALGVSITVVLMIIGTAVALVSALALSRHGSDLTIELRRRLTKWLANSNQWLIILVALALVDSIGAAMAGWISTLHQHWLDTISTTSILPLIAYFIKKLSDWFGGTRRVSMFSYLQRFTSAISLIVGVALFGIVAVAGDSILHAVAWPYSPWRSEPHWAPLGLLATMVFALALLSGRANGFINLSSLHFFYESRLTRAYLGATNNHRLEAAATPGPAGNIKESHSADYIQPELYCTIDLPAPIHIINTTINETIDPESQLVARDRKGNLLSLEPSGIRIGKEVVRWRLVGETDCAEQLSLGQWCAISGAAVSAGMGRLTNLGLAFALTFANIRLGYWWWSPGTCKEAATGVGRAMKRFSRAFGTFIYLANEMTARYSRVYQRKYLTDGGHFENTAAYRLIERRIPLIIVSDNGADPTYRFEDLENLTRKVRLDLGMDLQPLGGAGLRAFLDSLGAVDRSIFIDATAGRDWREDFKSEDSGAFVLVLEATSDSGTLNLIWIKPRAIKEMPPDILVYTSANPPFPQQTTGDQFFDEAQWESYRALGEVSMSRLLSCCPGLLA